MVTVESEANRSAGLEPEDDAQRSEVVASSSDTIGFAEGKRIFRIASTM